MKKSASVHIVPILMSLMLANGLTSHVIINPLVLDAAGRDAWLSVIFATVLLVPWTLMLAVFMKRT